MTFITFEGIDGSGKSTVAKIAAERLGFALTAEPTEGPLGMELRQATERRDGSIVEALLFTADRYTHTEQIKKWLAEGKGVISDRYFHSTIAYQLAELQQRAERRGEEWNDKIKREWKEWLVEINRPASIAPDITILIDVDVETALARVGNRGKLSNFEKRELLEIVRKNYLELADDGRWNIAVIDGAKDVQRVAEAAMKEIERAGRSD